MPVSKQCEACHPAVHTVLVGDTVSLKDVQHKMLNNCVKGNVQRCWTSLLDLGWMPNLLADPRFCHEHAGNVVVKCESDVITLRNKLQKGTIHCANVAVVVVMLVPHHAVYYTGYPVLACGSCNTVTATHMQELLRDLVEMWTNTCTKSWTEKLMARGCIMGVATDADSRHLLAQQLSIPLGFKMGLLVRGVGLDMAPWGGTICDPQNLLKRVRTLVLLHGMVLDLGHPINGDTLRVLDNGAGVQLPNQSMFNPKDKQHVECAWQLLRCVTRVSGAL